MIIQSLNSSFNSCQECSGLYCYQNKSLCKISYSSISNCNSSTYYVILLDFIATPYVISYSNILYNKQSSTYSNGLISTYSETTLYHDSIFIINFIYFSSGIFLYFR